MANSGNTGPHNINAIFQQAVAYLQQGQLPQAEAEAQKILAVDANQSDAYHLLGIIAAQSGQFERAQQLISRAVEINPGQPAYFHNLATAYLRGGRLDEALTACDKALQLNAQYPQAHNTRCLVLRNLQRTQEALQACTRALQLQADFAEAHCNQAMVLRDLGRHQDALASARRALQLNPNSADALNIGALVLRDTDALEDALAEVNKALALNPYLVDAHINQANILRKLGRTEAALAACDAGLRLQPDDAGMQNNRGALLGELGRWQESLVACERAVELNPGLAEAHLNRGNALRKLGRLDAALQASEQALALQPGLADAHLNHGIALRDLGHLQDALPAFRHAIELDGNSAKTFTSYGVALRQLGRLTEARAACEQAVALEPGFARAWNNLGYINCSLGDFDKAAQDLRQALALQADYMEAHSNLLFALAAGAALTPAQMLAEQSRWDQVHGAKGREAPGYRFNREASAQRRIRVGYVSPDFYAHPVSYFFEPLLANHDREQFEIFCYDAYAGKGDSVSERLRNMADHWHRVTASSDQQLADLIHADGIDILVDLTGHTGGNRLGAFTYRPAPVQLSYLGFFAGTGLAAMDYWITDETLHPADTEEQASETIVRLPRCWVCYQPSENAPAVGPCPHNDERVVFGSFSNYSKLNDRVIATWSRLLHQLPGSRLLLMDRSLNDPAIRELLQQRFAQHDVGRQQLLLREGTAMDQYLSTYNEVDIVLDPFPRTGGTTTADALWMGVPVVTLAGSRYVERISAGKLAALGLDDLITGNTDEYIACCVKLAGDPARRAALREGLRNRMASSELCDGPGLARAMEEKYRWMLDVL